MQLRITTFNLENLFNRYVFLDDPTARYEKKIIPNGVVGLDRYGNATTEATTILQRNNTARAILDCQPDVLAVQEVEDLRTLRAFNNEYLDGYFDRLVLLEGNDGRGINVGLCVRRGCKVNVTGIRTHADELTPEAQKKGEHIDRFFNFDEGFLVAKNALFSRDCLEVDVDALGVPLTFLINHLKSQSGSGGDTIRRAQATRVAEIVAEVKARGRRPIVLGDLNQDWSKDPKKEPKDPNKGPPLQAIRTLVDDGVLVDPFEGRDDEWTHYYLIEQSTSRLDYLLVDAALKPAIEQATEKPTILRRGLTLKCRQYNGERYPTVAYNGTEASDHCPVTVTLNLEAIPS